MTLISPTNRILLRGIAVVYLLLFCIAFTCSAYYLKDVIALQPIPLIGLLKYLLLCVLFIILGFNALKAISLSPKHMVKLYRGTTNFKWLFMIATGISLLAKLGFFDTAVLKHAEVTNLQIGILLLMGIFCFWTDALLSKITEPQKKGQLK